MQALGNRIFLTCDFSQYIFQKDKIGKSKATLISQTFKVAESKVTLFYFIIELQAELLTILLLSNLHIWL